MVDSDGIVSLNKKQRRRIIKEKDHKNLQLTTAKYFPDFGNQKYELVDEPKTNPPEFNTQRMSNQSNHALQNNSST